MSNQNIKTIYNGVPEIDMSKKYVDLRNVEIHSEQDLVNICQVFRNPKFETFRVIYMKDDKIAGYESVTSIVPNNSVVFKSQLKKSVTDRDWFERGIEDISRRMYRLGANSYYLMHNHPSGDAKASMEDMKITRMIAKYVNGFLGHVIVDHGTYSWISIDKKGKVKSENRIRIDPTLGNSPQKTTKENPFLTVKIGCKNDLARLMYDIKNSSNYSTLILTNCKNHIRLIQEVPNTFINMDYRQIGGYIKNRALDTGSTKAFFTTTDKPFFDRAKELVNYGFVLDCISYKIINDKAEIIEKSDSKSINQDIFESIKKHDSIVRNDNQKQEILERSL